ncbi:hypothetical protein Hanom_Chr11g00987251 [Helianthus anomalus]
MISTKNSKPHPEPAPIESNECHPALKKFKKMNTISLTVEPRVFFFFFLVLKRIRT